MLPTDPVRDQKKQPNYTIEGVFALYGCAVQFR